MGFVDYVKMRLLGADDRFRKDTTYIMFIFLVKETVELKRSIVMFFRKAKLHYKSDKTKLREAAKDEIECHDAGFKGTLFIFLF